MPTSEVAIPIGTRFSRLTVTQELPRNVQGKRRLVCQCVCGNTTTVELYNLTGGNTRSCGCLRIDTTRARSKTHGRSKSKIYKLWHRILDRCYDSNSKDFQNYGGRGIKVCDRWRQFENFLADMGDRPHGKTLDRRNNALGYSPENCRWATWNQQARNRRSNRIITVLGVTGCVYDVSDHFQISGKLVTSRLVKGWTPERAITQPKRHW